MSSSTMWFEHPELETIAGDRRGDRRYDLRLDMRWKLIRRRRVLDQGSGRTFDASSGGISFDAGKSLPVGLNVELSIAWPVLLHNVAPLQLVAAGKIVRSEGTRVAIRMSQHEFRTAGIPAEHRQALAGAARTISILKPSGTPRATNVQ